IELRLIEKPPLPPLTLPSPPLPPPVPHPPPPPPPPPETALVLFVPLPSSPKAHANEAPAPPLETSSCPGTVIVVIETRTSGRDPVTRMLALIEMLLPCLMQMSASGNDWSITRSQELSVLKF